MGCQGVTVPGKGFIGSMQVLVFVVNANFPIAIVPKWIFGGIKTDTTAGIDPKSCCGANGVKEGRVVALGSAWFLPLYGKTAGCGDDPHKAIMAQFIRRLVERVNDAVGHT